MLYVSRRVGILDFCVKDTETGVEEILQDTEIRRANLTTPIHGIDSYDNVKVCWESLTGFRAKQQLLHRAFYQVENEVLLNLTLLDGANFVVSDIATEIAPYSVNVHLEDCSGANLYIDSKIKRVSPDAFFGVEDIYDKGLMIYIWDASDDIADEVYRAFGPTSPIVSDDLYRSKRFIAEQMILNEYKLVKFALDEDEDEFVLKRNKERWVSNCHLDADAFRRAMRSRSITQELIKEIETLHHAIKTDVGAMVMDWYCPNYNKINRDIIRLMNWETMQVINYCTCGGRDLSVRNLAVKSLETILDVLKGK